jgi:hypothetical protein
MLDGARFTQATLPLEHPCHAKGGGHSCHPPLGDWVRITHGKTILPHRFS